MDISSPPFFLPRHPRPKGRLAPSPTGNLHLGNAFSFLMAWLSMAAQGGTLVLRMEDIDPDRSRQEFALGIMEDLAWIGLSFDEGPCSVGGKLSPLEENGDGGPYVQSLRLGRYSEVVDNLQSKGLVYPCFCTRKELRMLASAPHIGDEGVPYPGTCRNLSQEEQAARIREGKRYSLRLNTAKAMAAVQEKIQSPEGELLSFCDAVRGAQYFTMADCGGDFALRRSDGVFAYQLAVSIDDAAMGITEVVRGEDLLYSTPRQILLLRLLGAQPPKYAHIPLVCDAFGERLAKRHKSLELKVLRQAGITPQAVIGYLGYLAGFTDTPSPISAHELIPRFSFSRLCGRSPQIAKDWRF